MSEFPKATVLCLDVKKTGDFHVVTCGSLDDYHRYLDCETFDITYRSIGGNYYDIYCDDIGLFDENPIPSAFDEDLQPVLVGNLIFANHDREGNTTSLTNEDIKHIKQYSLVLKNAKTNRAWRVVCPCEY